MLNTNDLIFGKNSTDRIVSIEPDDGHATIFREMEDGTIEKSKVPCSRYILFHEQLSPKFTRLKGDQYYKYIMEYSDVQKYQDVLSSCYKKRIPLHVVRDPKEALMIKDGYTLFKGMKVGDVSVLSTDLETTGVSHDKNSKVLLISNTFRRAGVVTRKLFSLDEFSNQEEMLESWTAWVRQMNPSVICGHNIFGFDLPYLNYVAKRDGYELRLGRDGSPIRFHGRTSQFRKDGSQAYDYVNAYVYGRELIDTWFLSMKYDVSARREYESYKLKEIIEHELEALKAKKKAEPKKFTADDEEFLKRLSHGGNRQFYDAAKIKDNWHDPVERCKIKAYAIDDADDALTLYDLMIPSLFYYTQSMPRSFQSVVNTATGSQINSLMVRGYLQQGHSIALGSEKEGYEGAISFGVPGIHKNVFKIDVQSLYPSIIISKRICNRRKDPQELFLQIIEHFTAERIRNKERFETTGDRYYSDLSDSQKIVINSMYGFLGAGKVNYNYPDGAAEVTRVGREILKQAILWASGQEYMPVLEGKDEAEDDAA